MAHARVAGDLYVDIEGQILEIKRQLRQKEGYPYNPMQLVEHLQAAIEGKLVDRHGKPFNRPFLNPFGMIRLLGTTKPFVVAEKFAVDTKASALVKIFYLNENFQAWFTGKIETPAVKTTLRYAELVEESLDAPILAELGDKAETTLDQVYALMERQPNGEEGILLTNGWANVFYIRDVNGALRAVSVFWHGDGWDVDAYSVGHPFGWRAGRRVFSRNS